MNVSLFPFYAWSSRQVAECAASQPGADGTCGSARRAAMLLISTGLERWLTMSRKFPKRANSTPLIGGKGIFVEGPISPATGVAISNTIGCISRRPYFGGTLGIGRREEWW